MRVLCGQYTRYRTSDTSRHVAEPPGRPLGSSFQMLNQRRRRECSYFCAQWSVTVREQAG